MIPTRLLAAYGLIGIMAAIALYLLWRLVLRGKLAQRRSRLRFYRDRESARLLREQEEAAAGLG